MDFFFVRCFWDYFSGRTQKLLSLGNLLINFWKDPVINQVQWDVQHVFVLKLNLLLPSHHPFWWDYFFLEKSSSNIFQAHRNPCAGCVCRNFQKTPFFRECSIFFSENIDSALILQEKLATKLVLFTGLGIS